MADSSNPPGKVFLVGAGPGDPGLLTLKGLQCLSMAEVILYDGLVNPLLLRHTKADAERTCRVGGPGERHLEQEMINQRLIESAKQGKIVVRLKGGDPYIFGRGSEEAAALEAAGIPFEVVPGVTAATAAGAYAGLSLTHRDYASAVAFVTGHERPDREESSLDYQNLATFPGTLVFYMGLHRLGEIAASLMAHGKNPATPACVISRATTPLQRVVSGSLAELPELVSTAKLKAPSLIIIGDCVQLRGTIDWYDRLPLLGRSIGITRPEGQADNAVARAIQLGAEPVLMPTIKILPVEDWGEIDATLNRLHEFDWLVLTSANGVQGLLGRLWELGGDSRKLGHLKIATIGPATAEALNEFRLRADLVPEEYRAEALAESLKPHVQGKRVLWARANRGRDVLPQELTKAGAEITELVVYRNEDVCAFPPSIQSRLEQGEIHWIGLSSPSIARQFRKLLSEQATNHLGSKLKLASISPVTSAAAREVGLPVHAEASEYTWEGIFQAILQAEQASA